MWDARDGKLLHAQPPLGSSFVSVVFRPDPGQLIASTADGQLVSFSTETWEIVRRTQLDASVDGRTPMSFAGFLADGTLVAVGGLFGGGGGTLHRINADALTITSSNRAHDGSPKSLAISPDGTLVATGASDGLVRVWDGSSGTLVHQFSVRGQAQGVAFVDERHVAVTPQSGSVIINTIDPEELLQTVSSSLTRAFRPEECARFNFADACPTLDELKADP